MKPLKFPFFSEQETKKIKVTAEMIEAFGDVPKVTVAMRDTSGILQKQPVPVIYLENEYDEVTDIIVTTSNKNGFITIG